MAPNPWTYAQTYLRWFSYSEVASLSLPQKWEVRRSPGSQDSEDPELYVCKDGLRVFFTSGFKGPGILYSDVAVTGNAFYFEVPVRCMQNELSVKLIGFHFEVARQRTGFAYDRAGFISSLFGDRLGLEGEEIAPCFQVDDTIGCGYIKGLNSIHFFFTLNGNFAKSKILNYTPFELRPTMQVELRNASTTETKPVYKNVWTNFGQHPFKFNVEHWPRARPTWSVLPNEILEIIVIQALDPEPGTSQADNGTAHHKFLRSLSLVCRRWYKILHPHYSRIVTLKSFKHAAAQCEITLATLQELAILETGRLWFHQLLLSDVPQKMVSLVDMRRTAFDAGSCQTPRPLETVRSLMETSFGQVMSLTLTNHSFTSWRAFAKVIFAFPELYTLHLDSVSWKDQAPESPPSWLKAPGTIQQITLNRCKEFTYGAAWLFLCRPRPPSCSEHVDTYLADALSALQLHKNDVSSLAQICRTLCQVDEQHECRSVELQRGPEGSYTLALLDEAKEKGIHFMFSWSIINARHELAEIKAPMKFYAQVARESERLEWLKRHFVALSGSQNLRCTFDAEEDEEDTDEAYVMDDFDESDADEEESGVVSDSVVPTHPVQLMLAPRID